MNRNYTLLAKQLLQHWKLIIFSVVLIGLFAVIPVITQAQTTPEAPVQTQRLCQTWHVRSGLPENVYAEPSTTSGVIGRVSPNTNLCVYGISEENPLWLEINPDGPDAVEEIVGYILQEELRVGAPGTIANPNIFCDAWQVSTAYTVNVRSCPGTGCSVVTTVDPGDVICVSNYQFSGGNWSNVVQPGTNNSGFIRTSQLSYVYDESTGCPENSYQVLNQTNVYSCADDRCITDVVAPAGTRLCVTSDSFEGGTWVEYSEGNDPVGWILIDLLDPLESDLTLENVAATQEGVVATDTTEIQSQTEVAAQLPTTIPTLPGIGNNAQIAQVPSATPAVVATSDGTVSPTPIPGTGAGVVPVCPIGANPVVPGQCVTITPSPFGLTPQPPNGLLLVQNVPFQTLFIDNLELLSPQGTAEFFITLPDDWAVEGPVTLVLDVDYSENVTSFTEEVSLADANLSSRLDIRLDGVLASSINLDSDDVGRRLIEVPLPAELLADQTTRFHTISMELSARDYCEVNAETRISLNAAGSYVRAVYQEVIPALDLGRYPIPFFNSPIGLETESVWIVLPDNPDDIHLQVAASVAAGLGRLTGNDLQLNALFASQVTDQIYRNNNMILIGEPTRNSLIQDLYATRALPSTVGLDGNIMVDGLAVGLEEGVIQLARNPQNEAHTILVATGLSELGLQRAGRALGGDPSLIGIRGEIAVITDATELFRLERASSDAPIGTYSFSDFGIDQNVVLVGAGQKEFNFNFDVPIGGDLREGAYIELMFNATNSVDLEASSLNVLINDVPISGSALSEIIDQEETIASDVGPESIEVNFRTIRINIPQGVVEPGQSNNLALLVDMRGDWGCDLPEFIWATISRNSLMYLPQESVDVQEYFPLVSQFPIPFNRFPNLEDVFISMPAEIDEVELQQLIRLMSTLGDATDFGEGIIPVINRGAFPAGTNLAAYHLVVLGRPTENAFLAELNDSLQQKFFAGSDELIQEWDDITYRLGPGINLGVIEILRSPWNDSRVVLVMTGTSELGQSYAGNALFNLAFGTAALEGNIVFVSAVDANYVDTRLVGSGEEILQAASDTSLIGLQLSATPTITPTPQELLPTVTGTIPPTQFTAEAAAVATGIFTDTPTEITPTELPTLRPIPTPVPLFPTGEGGGTLNIVLLVLGVVIVALSAYGGYRALRSRNDDDL